MHETPFFSMFGRQPRPPVDIILGIPLEGRIADTEELAQTRGTICKLLLGWHAEP